MEALGLLIIAIGALLAIVVPFLLIFGLSGFIRRRITEAQRHGDGERPVTVMEVKMGDFLANIVLLLMLIAVVYIAYLSLSHAGGLRESDGFVDWIARTLHLRS